MRAHAGSDQPRTQRAEFWQRATIRDALAARHFGQLIKAYRTAHEPALTQAAVARWLGMSQVQVSRLERPGAPAPSDLVKLTRWAATLQIPADLLWFSAPGAPRTVVDVDRCDMLKLAGAAAVGASGMLADPPWRRLADTLAGSRAPDSVTVTTVENRTRGFFDAEETVPARQLVATLRAHHRTVRALTENTTDDTLCRRLLTATGETEALAGGVLFDTGPPTRLSASYTAPSTSPGSPVTARSSPASSATGRTCSPAPATPPARSGCSPTPPNTCAAATPPPRHGASRTSPIVDDFFTAAQATAEITAECGNYEMWQRGESDAISNMTAR